MTDVAQPLALVSENSRLRSDLFAEKSRTAQLEGFRERFQAAIAERDATISALRADLAAKAEAVSDLSSRLGHALEAIAGLRLDLEKRDADSVNLAAEAASLRSALAALETKHGDAQVGSWCVD